MCVVTQGMFHVKQFLPDGQLLPFDVSRETWEKLAQYVALLTKWNQRINLVSRSDMAHIWPRHIIDSLQLIPFMEGVSEFMDMGSGGGLPAIVVACATDIPVVMIESDARKAAFLREALRLLTLKGEVLHGRIENMAPHFERKVPLVTARALASLGQLLEWSHPFLDRQGVCVFLKGRNAEEEIEQARKKWSIEVELTPSLTSPDGVIVRVSHIEAV